MRIFSILAILVLALFGMSFAVLNAESVKLNYFFGTQTLPLSLLLILTLATGFILGSLIQSFMSIKYRRESRRLKSRLNLAEKEIENLRAIPLKNTP